MGHRERRIRHYGDYDNLSAYVRVVVDDDVANGAIDPAALPFGYLGPQRLRASLLLLGSNVAFPIGTAAGEAQTIVKGNANIPFTAASSSLLYPQTDAEGNNIEVSFVYPAIRTRLER